MTAVNEMTIRRLPDGRFTVSTEQTGLGGARADEALREVNWFLNLSDLQLTAGGEISTTIADAVIGDLQPQQLSKPIQADQLLMLRQQALDHAVLTHGKNNGYDTGKITKDVTEAAAAYLRFLMTGEAVSGDRK